MMQLEWLSIQLKSLLLAPFILGLIPLANAGVYYYTAFQKGIVVNCANGIADHIVEFKAGRGVKLPGHGDKKYEWPKTYLFPEERDKRYKYFPSTAMGKCSYRKLKMKEKKNIIKEAFLQCKKDRFKYCYGWN